MKKIALCLIAGYLTLLLPFQSNATTTKTTPSIVVSKPDNSPEAKALVLRLHEIKDMDMSVLNHDEKKELRMEVHAIKQNLSENHGGVYISAVGIIVIILLLIILL